jgi:hypothetical protein
MFESHVVEGPLMTYSIRYGFSQHFQICAADAYKWCVDYDPGDRALMHSKGKRKVLRLSEETIILTDKFYMKGKRVTKKKLVTLYSDRLSWTSTHLTGPNKYSQFLYEIKPETNNTSRLYFSGLQVENQEKKKKEKREIESLGNELEKQDSAAWKLLAKEMEKELLKQK